MLLRSFVGFGLMSVATETVGTLLSHDSDTSTGRDTEWERKRNNKRNEIKMKCWNSYLWQTKANTSHTHTAPATATIGQWRKSAHRFVPCIIFRNRKYFCLVKERKKKNMNENETNKNGNRSIGTNVSMAVRWLWLSECGTESEEVMESPERMCVVYASAATLWAHWQIRWP